MRELFIYYRTDARHGDLVAQRVADFQALLTRQAPALRARLLRRPEVQSGRITWMETYSMDGPQPHPHGVDAHLQSMIDDAAQVLRDFIDGVRHVEVFEACA